MGKMKRAGNTAGIKGVVLRYRAEAWRALAMLVLAAFTLQSFVTQTHIHGSQAGAETGIVKIVHVPSQGQNPLDTSESGCAFCQAVAHSGVFFAPSSPALVLPTSWALFFSVASSSIAAASALAHDWQSRAPPKA